MNKITYNQTGDYFIPEIAFSEQAAKPLGKYGRLRWTYLQEHRQALFSHLVLSEKLFPHLNEVDEQAHGVEHCETPEDLQEEILSSYRMNEMEKITKTKRELTEGETQAVNENCSKLLALCKK